MSSTTIKEENSQLLRQCEVKVVDPSQRINQEETETQSLCIEGGRKISMDRNDADNRDAAKEIKEKSSDGPEMIHNIIGSKDEGSDTCRDFIDGKHVEVVEKINVTEIKMIDNKSEAKEIKKNVTHYRIGIHYPVDEDSEEFEISCGRISKIENLSRCKNLSRLVLISNLITKIENLEENVKLNHLELYQNSIESISNIGHLTNLRVLDLSFNHIRKIENLSTLVNLEKLYLSSNKITEIEGLENLVNLQILELGCNRVRVIKGIGQLNVLRELWLGKNKITNLNVPSLKQLKNLSVQSNRLEEFGDAILNLLNINELYLSHNMIKYIPEKIYQLCNLKILDVGNNVIEDLSPVKNVESLQELWINNNQIGDIENIKELRGLKFLTTLYLEHNPLQYKLGPGYRAAVLKIFPNLEQLDAVVVKRVCVP